MSNTVFPFTVFRPYSENRATDTVGTDRNGGLTTRRAKWGDSPGWLFVAEFTVRLPYNSQSIDDWDDFIEAREGAKDTFLFKAKRTQNYVVTDEAVGTGDGSTTVFALDKKHLDSSTLVVKVNAVTKTGGGTDYTFSGNNTAPILTFNVAPTAGHAVTASYEFYMPVWFASDPPAPEQLGGGGASSGIPHRISRVQIAEAYPGAHLV
mgnify:CR=1 FL=1